MRLHCVGWACPRAAADRSHTAPMHSAHMIAAADSPHGSPGADLATSAGSEAIVRLEWAADTLAPARERRKHMLRSLHSATRPCAIYLSIGVGQSAPTTTEPSAAHGHRYDYVYVDVDAVVVGRRRGRLNLQPPTQRLPRSIYNGQIGSATQSDILTSGRPPAGQRAKRILSTTTA